LDHISFSAIAVLTDGRNRLSINLTYRIRYSSRNFSCIRHPQDNKPRRVPHYAGRIRRPHLGRCLGIAGGHIAPKAGAEAKVAPRASTARPRVIFELIVVCLEFSRSPLDPSDEVDRACSSESSLPPPGMSEPPPGTSVPRMTEPPSVMGCIVNSIVSGRQSGIAAAGGRAVRPQGIELNNSNWRKETKLRPSGAPVVMVSDDFRRVGAGGQKRNCHCGQANRKLTAQIRAVNGRRSCDNPPQTASQSDPADGAGTPCGEAAPEAALNV
jgi:hypothetical protein